LIQFEFEINCERRQMTNLSKLRVSLTKNGYHKVWALVKKYPITKVLQNVNGGVSNIHIEEAQARGILTGKNRNEMPLLWNEARKLSDESIQQLVLIAIIFSHCDLIQFMKDSSAKKYNGVIKRSGLGAKAYTNFAYTLTEFKLVKGASYDESEYDLSGVVGNSATASLAKQIIEMKLVKAGWDKSNDFYDECAKFDLNNVFSIPKTEFKLWLEGDVIEGTTSTTIEVLDEELDEESGLDIEFSSGIGDFAEEAVHKGKASTSKVVELKHAKIQKSVYAIFCKKYGSDNVGTENKTGYGTKIDIVIHNGENYIFYEVKTGGTLKKCIREAFGQLMEYSIWGGESRAETLVILTPHKVTDVAKGYVKYIRDNYGIEIYCQRYNESTKKLGRQY